ncbi:DgyrCDS5179 [Dimorphilus gyrociliatus]|uniref:DgyrCDS5179 n=1 Tax=Dimorphilus gyrociliatus TaxID=2664684 RepID=A0A7I8VJ12_9ANNE|nr:DgyrCDS5179 [Dimorphilus gyrociliatus]
MLTILHKSIHSRYSDRYYILGNQYRTYLSPSYTCTNSWAKRLETPILKDISTEDFALKIQSKLDKGIRIASVDMDILANKLELIDTMQLDYMETLFYKFRHTAEAVHVKESTNHAFIRALIKFGEFERLFKILQDPINYGIFLDDFTSSQLLDHFIVNEDFHSAAQVAYQLMLQEEFSHPISRILSLHGCDQHWRKHDFSATNENDVEDKNDDEEEEEWIRVGFITPPWFDGHFDIKNEQWLLGKTFTYLGREIESILGRSYQLIGHGLFEKFDQGLELLKADNSEKVVAIEAMEAFKILLENCPTKEDPPKKDLGVVKLEDVIPYVRPEEKEIYIQEFNKIYNNLKLEGKLEDLDLEKEVKKLMENTIAQTEAYDIEKQEKLYKNWNEIREESLKKEIEAMKVDQEKKEIAEKLIQLQNREEKLSYFEQLEKIKLGIQRGPKIVPITEVKEEEEFVAAPGERGRKKQ